MSRDNKAIVKEINEESHPSAGGTMAKPDNYDDALGNPGRLKKETEFEAKDKPGAARAACKKQTFDKEGCDETMRTPCNTGCSHK